LLVLGAAVVVLGSLLPWAEVTAPLVGTVSKAGTEGDGVLTLIGALIFGGFALPGLAGKRSRGLLIAALVVALLVAAVAVVDMIDVTERFADVEDQVASVDASIGIGLWLVLLGAGVAVVGGVMALASRR
jgi:hypothetical protein